jgi:predicted class III extradiol MEMO1 family dioxygenase
MDSIAFDSTRSLPSKAHRDFAEYERVTKNTICGRHPIGVLLGALAALEEVEGWQASSKLEWIKYDQSNKCQTVRDSSVSYASGVVSRC